MKTSHYSMIAAVLCMALGGGAYFLGKNEADQRALERTQLKEGLALESGRALPSHQAATQGGEEGSSMGLQRLLEEVVSLYRGAELNPDGLLRAEELLKSISEEDLAEAAIFLKTLKEEEHEIYLQMADLILSRWGASGGEEAVNAAMGLDKEFIPIVLSGWARENGEDAYAWYQESSNNVSQTLGEKRGWLKSLFQGWVAGDPIASIGAFEELHFDDHRLIRETLEDAINESQSWRTVSKRIGDIKEDTIKSELVEHLCEGWALLDPKAAAAWVDSVEFKNARYGYQPAEEVFERWAMAGDIEGAVDWFWPKLPDYKTPELSRQDFLDGFVGRMWGRKDKAAATAWLKEKGYDPAKFIR